MYVTFFFKGDSLIQLCIIKWILLHSLIYVNNKIICLVFFSLHSSLGILYAIHFHIMLLIIDHQFIIKENIKQHSFFK